MLNSFEDLNNRFAQVASQPHAVTRKSAGAVGELFEALMVGGIVGNQKGADFAEIATEAKVHYRTGELTIFSCKGEMIRCIDGACFPSLKPAEIKAKRGKSTVRVGDGLTEQGGQGGKGITKQARNAQRYIEARAVEHGEWENLNPRHAL